MSMPKISPVACLAAACSLMCADASLAHAHFRLLNPASWLKEGSLGEPQKGSPCGPGGYDDVKPVPTSGDMTTFHAGDTITVEVQETVYHAGYWRIALSDDRTTFKDPPLVDTTACSFDLDSVPTTPHDNVLLDGLDKTAATSGALRHLTHQVTLPNTPCDKCTLQVVQVMKDHGPPNCFYYHCADMKILPAVSGGGGTSGSAGATSSVSGGSGGTANSSGSSGSSVASGGSGGPMDAGAAGGTSATAGGAAAGGAASGGIAVSNSAGSTATAGTGNATAAGASAPVAATGAATSVAGSAASSPTLTPTASTKKSGCAVVQPGSTHAGVAAFLWLLASLALIQRRSGALTRARSVPCRDARG